MINLKLFDSCPSLNGSHQGKNLPGYLELSTDTRKYHHPAFFVALPGSRFNPLDLITNLLDAGCPLVIYQASQENEIKVKSLREKYANVIFLMVKDTIIFLQELSHAHILHWKNAKPNRTVFAISGSNGKTTHKEMLAHILKSILPEQVVATEKNNNNHLGVPLTLLNVHEKTEFVVLELGSNHPGEIKVLCDIAAPNAGLTTNIGATHLEFFGTEEKVFLEEGYLYYSVKENTDGKGFFLINQDDAFLSRLENTDGSLRFGILSQATAQMKILENGAEVEFEGRRLHFTNFSITGKHNKLNMMTCVLIAAKFFPSKLTEIFRAAESFRPTKNRSEWVHKNGADIYLDAYNANPSSMKAALEGFKDSVLAKGLSLDEVCVILGDMNELGEATPSYHEEVAHFVQLLGFKHAYFVGRFSQHYLKGFPEGLGRLSTQDFKEEYINHVLPRYQIQFIKGSRSLQLESLLDIT